MGVTNSGALAWPHCPGACTRSRVRNSIGGGQSRSVARRAASRRARRAGPRGSTVPFPILARGLPKATRGQFAEVGPSHAFTPTARMCGRGSSRLRGGRIAQCNRSGCGLRLARSRSAQSAKVVVAGNGTSLTTGCCHDGLTMVGPSSNHRAVEGRWRSYGETMEMAKRTTELPGEDNDDAYVWAHDIGQVLSGTVTDGRQRVRPRR
jgi:hypothetical protein